MSIHVWIFVILGLAMGSLIYLLVVSGEVAKKRMPEPGEGDDDEAKNRY